ncbi:TolC family protein [Magnetococcales bacterium HHB-1]
MLYLWRYIVYLLLSFSLFSSMAMAGDGTSFYCYQLLSSNRLSDIEQGMRQAKKAGLTPFVVEKRFRRTRKILTLQLGCAQKRDELKNMISKMDKRLTKHGLIIKTNRRRYERRQKWWNAHRPAFYKNLPDVPSLETLFVQSNGEHTDQKEAPVVVSRSEKVDALPLKRRLNISALTATDFVTLVKKRNDYLLSQKLEWAVSQDAVKNARSIFEPKMTMATGHSNKTYLNEDWTRAFFSGSSASNVVHEKTNTTTLSVETLTPIGGEVSVGYSLNERQNDLDLQDKKEYKGVLALSMKQPLLKDAGVDATKSNIYLSEIDAYIAFQGYRKKMIEVIAGALAVFWDLHKAQKVVEIRQDSLDVAEKMLANNQALAKRGKIAETEIYETEVGLLTRKALLSEAKQRQTVGIAKLKKYISSNERGGGEEIKALDEAMIPTRTLDFKRSLKNAHTYRPEYLIALKKGKREAVRVDYAENQTMPDLDLTGSYGLNSIENKMGDALTESLENQYKSWSVGVELEVPLGGNSKAQSELSAAKHRRRQAELEIRTVAVAMANDVKASIQGVKSAKKQIEHYKKAVGLAEKLLKIEMKKFRLGKGNSRTVLEREASLINAKESQLNSQANYHKALTELWMHEGSLLMVHGIGAERGKSW